MSNAIEIEAKVLIKEDDYKKLAKAFPAEKHYTQTNYYIDNDERILAKEGIALRVREKEGHFEITLKTPLSHGLLEKSENITAEQFNAFKREGVFPKVDAVRLLTMLDIDVPSLRILTALTTDRMDLEYENGLLSIDRNQYSGTVDYEVEFEYNNLADAERILSDFLGKYGIPVVFSKLTKVHRAMAALESL